MRSLWSEPEAERRIAHYAAEGVGRDLALRVYAARLLGGDPKLVLHGGGNSSVKTVLPDLFGEEVEALCVKGSGWDLDAIEPQGFPMLDLAWLRRLRKLEQLSDEEMVNQLRTHLFDAAAPNPSVETLLHAFLPHAFVDHTHADAILALTNRPDGAGLVREALGDRFAIVPYVAPGFRLAKLAAEIFEKQPDVEGMVLLKHGLFTFAQDARTSYERTIDVVGRAESFLRDRVRRVPDGDGGRRPAACDHTARPGRLAGRALPPGVRQLGREVRGRARQRARRAPRHLEGARPPAGRARPKAPRHRAVSFAREDRSIAARRSQKPAPTP